MNNTKKIPCRDEDLRKSNRQRKMDSVALVEQPASVNSTDCLTGCQGVGYFSHCGIPSDVRS